MIWDRSVTIIQVNSGDKGSVGIKIPLKNVDESRPIIVTSGDLGGGFMVYAIDYDNFYAIHTGWADNAKGNRKWKTGREGVITTNKV